MTVNVFYLMGTGARALRTDPQAQKIYSELREFLRDVKKWCEDKGFTLHIISGMAEGWDEALAKAAIAESIPFTAAIPNHGYAEHYWGKASLLGRNRISEFNAILEKAAEVVYVCDWVYHPVTGEHANFVRNRWMVNKATHALVYDPSSSGTRHGVAELKKAQVPFDVFPFQGSKFRVSS